jgi:hypothetical protein
MHCVFILLQVLLLRENYQLVQLLQLPVAVAFGMMIDFAVWLLGGAHLFFVSHAMDFLRDWYCNGCNRRQYRGHGKCGNTGRRGTRAGYL